jgi:hypothetical protein
MRCGRRVSLCFLLLVLEHPCLLGDLSFVLTLGEYLLSFQLTQCQHPLLVLVALRLFPSYVSVYVHIEVNHQENTENVSDQCLWPAQDMLIMF